MKNQPKSKDQLIEEADAKIRAIGQLMECEGFKGFYLEQLMKRQADFDGAVLRDTSLSAEEREIRRRIGREYDILLVLHEQQLAMARKTTWGAV
jgi:hypothetical protein